MTARLEGTRAIVTGAGRGIGAGIARAFAAEGAAVAVIDLDEAAAEAVAAEIGAGGGTAVAIAADVSAEDAVAAMVDEAAGRLEDIDILVNNAGFGRHAEVVDMTLAQWEEVLTGNLTPVFLCSRAVLPRMIARGSGAIVNTGSQLGYLGRAGMSHYTAAKAAIHGFTKALAREAAPHGIRVNAIAPGPVNTDNLRHTPKEALDALRQEIPLKRFAEVEEIAPVAVLLASDEGSYFTGSVVNVSGGHLVS
jgi:3-oxoacyl-[acyl-carrier protein] reductase